MTGSRILVLVGLAAALATASCGRKPVQLETPSQAANETKRAGAGIGINQPVEAAPPPVEERRFILDGLI
jgi:hypothetical protein